MVTPLDSSPPLDSSSFDNIPEYTKVLPVKRGEWTWSSCVENELQDMQILLISYDAKKVLLCWEEARWVLPGFLIQYRSFESSFLPQFVIPIVHKMLGTVLPITLLRQAWRREKQVTVDKETRVYEKTVILMEAPENDCSFDEQGFQWISFEEAKVFHLINEAAEAIRREIRFALSAVPVNRLSWQRPGWFSATALWMEELLLRECNGSLTEDIKSLRSSELGVILQAKTTMGLFFLKCTAPTANDASYTQALSRIAPEYVAAPIVVDIKKQIMLSKDYGKILYTYNLSDVENAQLTRDYVRLQLATIDKTEDLIQAGIPDFRLHKLPGHIDRLAASLTFTSLGKSEESKGHVNYFRKSTEMFKEKLGKLGLDSDLPSTVTHNDLWSNNIYKTEDRENYMFFDFVDAYVSHPFASSISGLDSEVFLQEWSRMSDEEMEKLRKCFGVGQALRALAGIVLELRDGKNAELPEADNFFDRACFHLRTFNFRLREDVSLSLKEFREMVMSRFV